MDGAWHELNVSYFSISREGKVTPQNKMLE